MVTTAVAKADIEAVLSKIRSLSNQSGHLTEKKPVEASANTGFSGIINSVKNSLAAVNNAQNESQMLKSSYLQGDADVSLSQVLASSARSKVAFEGLITIRKHFIESYKEIMNMPI